MRNTVNVHEAKTHLSRLLERVISGEEVVIGKGRQAGSAADPRGGEAGSA